MAYLPNQRKKYTIVLTSLSHTLLSWQCYTQCSTVALGETQPLVAITCKWKMMTNTEKMHSSFPRREKISQDISTEIIVVLESVSDIRKYDNSLSYSVQNSVLSSPNTLTPKSYLLADKSAWWSQAVTYLYSQTVKYNFMIKIPNVPE